MMKRYMLWYGGLSDNKKLLVQFLLQWFYWGIAWYVFERLIPGEKPVTITRLLFFNTWMAVVMTIFTNWSKVKGLFKIKPKGDRRQ